ncbi:MAG: protein translocase subunit SecF [bacterium]
MQFLKYRKIYFFFSGILILASLACLIIYGLNFGIEFKGGSVLEVEYQGDRPSTTLIREKINSFGWREYSVRQSGESEIILSVGENNISQKLCDEVILKLEELGEIKKDPQPSFEAISSVVGKELTEKTGLIVVFSLLVIIFYVAFAFRKVSQPVSSWRYGIATLIALFHDVLIPLATFSLLGKFYGIQITIPIITALLTVFGYSVNNTVVVFDRIRENLLKKSNLTFEETVNDSLNQTLTRSINTSLTTLFVLAAIFFFGGVTLKYFALALIIGIFAGTYSSLFLVSPILVSWQQWRDRKKA